MTAMGRFEKDFMQAKSNSEQIADFLLKKFSWMLSIRFLGDISFHPNRRKSAVERMVNEGMEEVSFGLNMELVYLNKKDKERKAEVIFRFKNKPFYDVYFKPYKKNPTIKNLIEQFKDTWVICGSGNKASDPKAFAVFKVSTLPTGCFVPCHENGKVIKYKIAFAKFVKWNSAGQVMDIFGGDILDDLFGQIRN